MVQIGLNLGARNMRILGWAKSYTKTLSSQIKADHDRDALGALSILWSFVQSVMPTEVLSIVDTCLEKENLPRLATRNVKLGKYRYFFPFCRLTVLFRPWISYQDW
jgi:hypothetical protein